MTSFGLQLPNFTFGVPDAEMFEQVVVRAQAGESAGFSSLWVMDHFWQLPPLGGAGQPMLEAYTLLGALATQTRTVKLGTLVTGVTYRNPALVAKMVTTLDIVSGGRAVLGIGAAWHEEEHEGLGFDFPPARERLDRLEEALKICRAMFREDSPAFDGRYYRIHGATNVPRPLQPGGPSILVGGGGERRTLRLVARYADACNISGDATMVGRKVEILERHCNDVGRQRAEISVTRLGSLFLTSTADETRQVREFVTQAAGPDAAAGFTIGEPDEVVAQVAELVDAGVDEFYFNMPLADAEGIAQAGKLLTSSFS
ncbi:MAG: LLM class F420-dependent oxidoreductase [Actinobacteria bacterium]|nr:MAG: LLM class F420-dependent oxidoreductase [Actinomycetota bacterium]